MIKRSRTAIIAAIVLLVVAGGVLAWTMATDHEPTKAERQQQFDKANEDFQKQQQEEHDRYCETAEEGGITPADC